VTALSLARFTRSMWWRWVPFLDSGVFSGRICRGDGASSQRSWAAGGAGRRVSACRGAGPWQRWPALITSSCASGDLVAPSVVGLPLFASAVSSSPSFARASCPCGRAGQAAKAIPRNRRFPSTDSRGMAIGQAYGRGVVDADEKRRRTGLRLGDVVQANIAPARSGRGGRRLQFPQSVCLSLMSEPVDTIAQHVSGFLRDFARSASRNRGITSTGAHAMKPSSSRTAATFPSNLGPADEVALLTTMSAARPIPR